MVPIPEFPDYWISDDGRVINHVTGRALALTRNNRGLLQVGMQKDGMQCKRSVALLVADAFLFRSASLPAFDTPIHLNGDRLDCRVENLMWRPRWFAIRYHQQFSKREQGYQVPVRNTKTGEVYENSWHAATTLGLLESDLVLSIHNHTYVWPLYQIFELIRD